MTGTAYAHTGLTAGLTYYYLVAAVDTNDERGAWSEQLSVTVPDSMTVLDAPAERAALVALYEAADGVNWTQNDNWSTAASISTWYGVTTDESGLVVELLLSGNGLSGLFADLSALTKLTSLDLSANQQLCLPGGYGFSGLTGAVTAHLQSLNLPTCAAS